MTITAQTIITTAAVLTALGVIGALALKILGVFTEHQKLKKDAQATKKELALLTYGLLACLKGLAEQGCNGPVHEAIDKIEKHLNTQAHE